MRFSTGFILVLIGRLSGRRLARLPLAVCLLAAFWAAVEDALQALRCLEVLPGAQEGGVVDQRVHQLPAGANPTTAGRSARRAFLDSCKHRAGCEDRIICRS